ncbi:sugar-binding transcriptional regulator [Actibacterium lipolyticum]|uniref:Transcriptional regulator LsrR n=1 Tax=Actibacterium lipolyticum TaxID=1524263 RepID=A0A238JYA4_9RHOB|nr:sugar-binding transcriptional regulator [Actibacterium lipolyticum]SMX34686.1 Transcriptional regulator LsrR [Actibacterium lipolyticum]
MKNNKRLDDAARAAWHYYIAGNTQDEIAAVLGVSRQSAQRLVSQAMSAGLVKVRIDHPMANCMDLASKLKQQFGLKYCEVVPTDPNSASTTLGVAEATADVLEDWLSREEPVVIALGTGRALRAAVQQMGHMECDQHKIVSLTGNISPDGSTAYYNVLFSIGEKVTARTFPLPMPVVAASPEERDMLMAQKTIRQTLDLVKTADVAIVGIGEMTDGAPLFKDGFISKQDLAEMRAAGAVGEIVGWAFDKNGDLIDGLTNSRVASPPLLDVDSTLVIGSAMGQAKLEGIRGAIKGHLINGLLTDEKTAEALLK